MTGWNGMRPRNYSFFDHKDDRLMLRLWRAGHDTLDIARVIDRPESEIANRLPHVLSASRQEAEWSRTA